jgi:hypothetical protein
MFLAISIHAHDASPHFVTATVARGSPYFCQTIYKFVIFWEIGPGKRKRQTHSPAFPASREAYSSTPPMPSRLGRPNK